MVYAVDFECSKSDLKFLENDLHDLILIQIIQVYEWGYSPVSKQNMPLKKTYTNQVNENGINYLGTNIYFSIQKGVTACRLGASFSCLLTKDNLVLIKGKIEGIVD